MLAQRLSPCVTVSITFLLPGLSFPIFVAEGLSLPRATFCPNMLLWSRALYKETPGVPGQECSIL